MNLFEKLNIDLDSIKDKKVKNVIIALFNIIEEQSVQINNLLVDNQNLKNEINHLNGEQGKPDIKPQNQNTSKNISSEAERKKKKKKKKSKSKKKKIKIDREQKCTIDTNDLPNDVKFKGYQYVVVQDISIKTDNIKFSKEVYYSPSLGKTFIANLPSGYEGEFGPNLKALTIILKNISNMSEPKILELFHQFEIVISASTISNILIKNKDNFHEEKKEIFHAGLESSKYQQIDDTSARVNGENHYTQVLCNEYYSAFFTNPRKDRLTVLDILNEFNENIYIFNHEAIDLLQRMKVPKYIIHKVRNIQSEQFLNEIEINLLIEKLVPDIGKIQLTRMLEASAIAAYHKQTEHPVIDVLLCDDAPQFKLLTQELALCWVHEGRHFKKINPVIPHNNYILTKFLKMFWIYYRKLLRYKTNPSKDSADILTRDFDILFSKKTGYDILDDRIKKTKLKKTELLLVLKHPEIPLHNNAAELAARAQVRKRDVSLQTKTEEGTDANDTFLTIGETAKKLGLNIYNYIFDRVSKKYSLPSLADMIRIKSATALS